LAANLLRASQQEQSVRIVTVKRPPPAFDGVPQDNFHLGDVYEVSPNLGIFMTAAGWVRSETHKDNRRRESQESADDLAQANRRNLSDRPH
jgi:hypothetical protein